MSDKKQSSIEWLMEKIQNQRESGETDLRTTLFYCEQAKAMHKEEIENSYDYMRCIGSFTNGKEYYKEMYTSNASELGNSLEWNGEVTKGNNHIVDTNEMIDHIGDANKMVDKEIFEQAIKSMEEMYGSGCDSEIDAYFRGAKWMQKQFIGGQDE